MSFRDPVFRGATRPSMFMGAPMIPFIMVTGLAIMAAMLGLFISPYIFIGVLTIYTPIYGWMRVVTKTDDQRLNQVVLRMRLRLRMQANQRFWGALTYTPIKFKKR